MRELIDDCERKDYESKATQTELDSVMVPPTVGIGSTLKEPVLFG